MSPGGMYWQDPEALTSTLVWNVASNLSSALQGENSVWIYCNIKTIMEPLKSKSKKIR